MAHGSVVPGGRREGCNPGTRVPRAAPLLISPDSRRTEPPADEPHYHVWRDHGKAQTIMAPRFGTNQAARKAALRAGMRPGEFAIRRCDGNPCRATIRSKRRRKRRRCRHCGRVP